MSRIISCAIIALMLAACGGDTEKHVEISPIEQGEARLLRSGESSFERGEYQDALVLFTDALKLGRSIEDADGIAAARLSMAATHRAMGKPDMAHAELDALLLEVPLGISAERQANAAMMKAMLYRDAGDAAGAGKWADAGLRSCGGCALEPRLHVLKSLLDLDASKPQEALSNAERGISKAGDKTEARADAHRAAADALSALGKHKDASEQYGRALEIDRAIGKPGKIGMDLVRLGRSEAAAGNKAEAAAWFKRALSVCEAAEHTRCRDEAASRLKALE